MRANTLKWQAVSHLDLESADSTIRSLLREALFSDLALPTCFSCRFTTPDIERCSRVVAEVEVEVVVVVVLLLLRLVSRYYILNLDTS